MFPVQARSKYTNIHRHNLSRIIRMSGLYDTHFSPVGYVIGLALVVALVMLPVLAMGLRSKSIFQRRSAAGGSIGR